MSIKTEVHGFVTVKKEICFSWKSLSKAQKCHCKTSHIKLDPLEVSNTFPTTVNVEFLALLRNFGTVLDELPKSRHAFASVLTVSPTMMWTPNVPP